MKLMMLLAGAMLLPLLKPNDDLTGRWVSPVSPKGNVTIVVFKPDNSFEGFVNKKPFVSGHYTLKDSVFSFVDNGCDGKRGEYRLIFFSNADSLRFEPISDSCIERREGMQKLVMGRTRSK